MKMAQLHSVERTGYYSGMLLSEKDMINEQLYMNSRRYIGNRFLHGVGIAGGLTVIKVDEELLSLEIGLAIDNAGRELFVEKPRLMRLNQIPGYADIVAQDGCNRAYLCIKYDEEGLTEEDICLTDEGNENRHCKRIREGYQVYLTNRPIVDTSMTIEYFRGKECILFKDDNLVVLQRIPNFLEAGKTFETEIIMIAMTDDTQVDLHLNESLSCADFDNKEVFTAEIKKTIKTAYTPQVFKYDLHAYAVEDGTAEMRVLPEYSYITVNGEKKELIPDIQLRTPVTGRDRYQEILARFYADHFDQQMSGAISQDIYLATILLDRVDGELKINRVQNVPFDQYLPSAFLQMGLLDRLRRDVTDMRREMKRADSNDDPLKQHISKKPKISSGEYVFKIAVGAKEGQRLISEEIVHGLGLGPVFVSVSLIEDMKQQYGAPGIFDETELKIETAVLCDMSKGNFRIGVKVAAVTAMPEIKVHWIAMMNPAEKTEDQRQKRIRIVPDKLEMKTLQNYYLKAEADNLIGAVILWEVVTPNGGVINRDGLYTAPDLPGVYEVSAFCQESPEIRDTMFIIVRE